MQYCKVKKKNKIKSEKKILSRSENKKAKLKIRVCSGLNGDPPPN